jgi:hypothetical protein
MNLAQAIEPETAAPSSAATELRDLLLRSTLIHAAQTSDYYRDRSPGSTRRRRGSTRCTACRC